MPVSIPSYTDATFRSGAFENHKAALNEIKLVSEKSQAKIELSLNEVCQSADEKQGGSSLSGLFNENKKGEEPSFSSLISQKAQEMRSRREEVAKQEALPVTNPPMEPKGGTADKQSEKMGARMLKQTGGDKASDKASGGIVNGQGGKPSEKTQTSEVAKKPFAEAAKSGSSSRLSTIEEEMDEEVKAALKNKSFLHSPSIQLHLKLKDIMESEGKEQSSAKTRLKQAFSDIKEIVTSKPNFLKKKDVEVVSEGKSGWSFVNQDKLRQYKANRIVNNMNDLSKWKDINEDISILEVDQEYAKPVFDQFTKSSVK